MIYILAQAKAFVKLTMKKTMKPREILIRKYENRRLYDTVNSRYVNLDEVASFLQQGNTIRVVDALSGEDITRLILTQIIVEDAKAPDSIFPVEVLRQMVVASGRATQDASTRYMQAMLDVYEKSYRVMTPPFPFSQPGDPATLASNVKSADGNIDELKRRVAELEALVSALSPGKTGRRPGTKPAGTRKKNSD